MVKNEQEILNKAYDKGFEYEQKYGYCAQAVLSAIQDIFGEINDEVIQASHSLAGGGSLDGDGTCGGYSGAMMAISAFFGRKRDQFGEGEIFDWMESSKLSKRIKQEFIDEYGSIICNDIQKEVFGNSYDLWDPKEFEAFEKAGAHVDKCPSITGNAAKWTAKVLLEEGVEPKQ
ncbi:MAG: C-GCAxxG-C-C family protein [Methanolobus sp.]|nr:C-GCAxxG-C-C family protein [Methanolobus sp.]